MPYTAEELALHLKNQDPLYQKYTNEELVKAAIEKFPELRDQVVDLGEASATAQTTTPVDQGPVDLESIKAQAEGQAGGRFADVLKGAGKGALGNVAGLADIALPGQPAENALGGAITPVNPDEQMGMTGANMASFFLPSGMGELAKIPGLANSPWMLRAISALMEGGKGAALTSAQGGGGGMTALQGILGAAGGALGASAPALEAGAAKNVARATGADLSQAKPVMDVAGQALNEGFMGTKGSLKRTSEERLKAALADKLVAEQSQAPVDLGGVAAELSGRASQRKMLGPQTNPALTKDVMQGISEMMADPRMGPAFVKKHVLPSLGATMDDYLQAIAAADAPITGDPQMVSSLMGEAKDVRKLHDAWKGEMPLSEVAKYAKGRGAVTRRTASAYSDIPGNDLSAGTEAGKEAAGLLKVKLHEVSPELGKADQKYHVYQTLLDALDKSALKDVTNDRKTEFLKYMAGRVAVGSAIGGGVGLGRGQHGSDLMMSVLGGAALGVGTRTALAQTTSATLKRALAKAIESGNYETGFHIMQGMVSKMNKHELATAPQE